jgi:NAD(P)-dependent dehydrogenase (short-subunit alcohol dehydrogenase family)
MAEEQRRSKAVLATGCSSGIGRATAERLAVRGWTVYATARRLSSIADLEDKGCRTLPLDVTEEQSMLSAVATITEAEGAVGVLVNNAGYSLSGAIETASPEEVRRQFETNVFGLIRLTQLVLPSMRRQGFGKIVNVSSMGGRMTFPGGGYYHATKWAVEALSDVLRYEVGGFGIDVIVIEPGLIRTHFGETAAGGVAVEDGPYAVYNRAVAERTLSAYERPMGRLGGDANSVARVIEKAISARRPRTRYRVTPSASLFLALHALLPDRAWDRLVGRGLPRPGSRSPAEPR